MRDEQPHKHPNDVLRTHRELVRKESRDEFAQAVVIEGERLGEHVACDARLVTRWEDGTVGRPRYAYQRILLSLTGCTPDELGFAAPSRPQPAAQTSTAPETDELERRAFLHGLGVVVGATVTGSLDREWDRVVAALASPRRTDLTVVEHLERVTVTLEEQYQLLAPAALVGLVEGHLSTLSRLVTEGLREHRPVLLSLTGETAALAGWVRADLGDDRRALAHYDHALLAAREAGDQALGAYVLGSATVLPTFRRRSPSTVVEVLTEGARGVDPRKATPRTRAWLGCLRAAAHARLGDGDGAVAALDDAAELLALAEPAGRRPRVHFFDRSRLAGERGSCLLELGRTAEARALFTDALRQADPAAKIRARFLTGLALSHAREGDVDEACRIATDSLSVAQRSGTRRSVDQVRDLRRDLQPWARHPAVRELDDHLAKVA